MATREEYEQLKAYARIDGAIVGGLWIISFGFFIGEFYNASLGIFSMITGLSSVFVVTMRLRRFRDNVLNGTISFRRAFGYSMLTFAYAALLMAAAQYVYFQFIDNGFIVSRYMEMTSTPEFKALAQAYGFKETELRTAINTLSELRPIDLSFQFLTTNIIIGVILSLPLAALVKSYKSNNHIK